MPTYKIENTVSGQVLGAYQARDENAALDAMARDAGYKDFADSCRVLSRTEEEGREDLKVTELP
jgi:hypothetical protein